MKKKYSMVAILSLAILALGLTEGSFARNKPSGQNEPSKRRVLIGFKDGTGHQAAERRKGWVQETGGEVRYSYRFVPAAAANLSETQISRFRADPRVDYIEEDGLVHALDPELDNSWGVKHIGAGNVHSYNKGAGVKVAIIDTGIDYTHPDLDGNYAGGYDFVNSDNSPMDDNGHGTHCAGIAAAEDNGEGVVGVAPEASVYGVKVLNSSGSGYLSDVVAGIQWAIDNGMDIISMSLGTNYNYKTLEDACDKAAAAGILLVAAAGNDYSVRLGTEQDTVDYPARYGSVIAVGAIDNTDTKASFSSTGLALELAAPGVNIKSTYRGGGYASGSGTSMACPHVAGTAALVLAGPGGDVRAILQNTADDLGNPGRDKWYGFGLVDADEAAGAPAGPPSADFIGDPLSGDKPLTVQFIDISTGDITDWSWAFGDGGTLPQQDPSHEYLIDGSYTVSLTVTGPGGSDTEIKTNYIVVTAPLPPTAAFSGSPTSSDAPLAVQFTDQSTGSITDWSWTFGDGGSSIEQSPSHEYQSAGSYTVSLTVTGPGGPDTETKTNYIQVTAPPAPVAAFSGSSTSGEAPLAVQFTDQSTGSITDWSWTFGDGGSSTEQSPSHEYQNAGSYTVSLTVTGPGGWDTETKTDYINVTSPAQIEVFFDSFESSYDWTANWSQDSQNDWRRRTTRSIEGNYAAEVDGFASNSQLISAPIDLHGKQNATITFWWYIESGLDAGEYLAFDVSTNGTWLEKARLRGNVDTEDAWHNMSIDVTGINNIRIRFRATMSGSTEDAYVDVVKVVAW
jgi:PKD repeat protein